MVHRAFKRAIPLTVFALVLAAESGFCQQAPAAERSPGSKTGPVIVLTTLNAPEDDPLAEKLAATITSSTELVMRLAGGIVVKRADFLTPSLSLHRAELYYEQEKADGAVFGSVSPASGGAYLAKLEIWNASKSHERPVSFERKFDNPLEIFDIADELSLEAGSTLVGRKLTSGTLVLNNTGFLPHYSVYADGELLGRDRTSFQLLTGPRKIVVAKPGGALGDEPVEEFEVVIHDRQTTEVTLTEKPKVAEQTETKPETSSGRASEAEVPSLAGRSLLPTFGELNSQFTQLRKRDWPYALGFWGSYATIFAGVIVATSAPSNSSGTLSPQGAVGLGISALGLTGTAVTWLIDPNRSKLKDARLKISGLPVLSDNRNLEELRNELNAYRRADLPYTLTYWGSFLAVIGGVVVAASAQNTTNADGTTAYNIQRATGFGIVYAGLGGMIGTATSDPYREGIRQLRRKLRATR